ncbi:HAD family hydrolase [Dolosicoccus paucivorans]
MTKQFIFCVDSDGCVMDTMTFKHERFFGPFAADAYEVEDRETFLKNWDEINLYTKTRGVNRFTGLLLSLESIGYEGIERLKAWVEGAESLSNDSLKAEIEREPSEDLQRALDWSYRVNDAIQHNEEDDEYFPGAKSGLAALAETGLVYVVSSANKEAVLDEWKRHDLMQYVDDLYCQDRGQKADVIKLLLKQISDRKHVIMIGDSPGDLEAAEANGVHFYPILVGKEKESWNYLVETVLKDFTNEVFDDEEQQELIDQFWQNLE